MALIEINGLNKLSALIEERIESISNVEKFLDRLGTKYVQQSQLTFRTSTDPFGTPWKPLKLREGQALKKSGRLSNSIAHEATSTSVRVFVEGNLEYAAAHNNGVNEIVNIKSHIRRITQVFGRSIQPTSIKISSHNRKMNLPQRMFIPNEGRIPPKWFKIAEDMITKDFKG
jgi:phage gpG-like protein